MAGKRRGSFCEYKRKNKVCARPLPFQSDDYDVFLRTRQLKDVTEEQFRAPPEEIIRIVVFNPETIKPREPRGYFRTLKGARIDTTANLKNEFLVWEYHGNKIKVNRRNVLYLHCLNLPFCLDLLSQEPDCKALRLPRGRHHT
jgi:hypothetical protein